MQRRMSLFLPALLTVNLGLSLSASSGAAADDCLAGPNAPSPPGTHWYYRVDRATHRQCWYLGAEGAHVRTQTRQAAAPARPASPKPSERSASPAAVQATSPEPVPAIAAGAEPATSTANAVEQPGTPAFPTRWDDAPKAAVAVDTGTTGARTSYAQEQSTLEFEDEMPLVWPILTPDELAAADQPTTGSAFAHLAGLFAAVMAIAALIGTLLLRITTGRRPRRSAAAQEPSLDWSTRAHRAPPHETFVETESPLAPTAAHDHTWPATPDDELEDTVPQLLTQLQRRAYQDELNDLMLAPAR